MFCFFQVGFSLCFSPPPIHMLSCIPANYPSFYLLEYPFLKKNYLVQTLYLTHASFGLRAPPFSHKFCETQAKVWEIKQNCFFYQAN